MDERIATAAAPSSNDNGLDDWVVITLQKLRGSDVCVPRIEASSPAVALNGIAHIVAEFSRQTGLQVFEVLSRLAVVLLAPVEGEVDGHG